MVNEYKLQLALTEYLDGRFPSLRRAAKAYNVSARTLTDRHNQRRTKQEARVTQQRLSPEQERLLVQWSIDREATGTAPNHAQIREMASTIRLVGGGPSIIGKAWVRCFLKRNQQVKTKIGLTLDHKRARNVTKEAIIDWYDELLRVMRLKAIQTVNIWNMDEIGTALGVYYNQTVVGSIDQPCPVIRRPNDREWCTAIECIAPNGRTTTPLLIFKS